MTEGNLPLLHLRSPASDEHIIDGLTRKVTALWRSARREPISGKTLVCSCGRVSTFVWRSLPDGVTIDRLYIHAFAYHRSEVPSEVLKWIEEYDIEGVEPTTKELMPPSPAHRYLHD